MKWFNNLKIRSKLLIVFGILVVIMISFAVFTVVEAITMVNTTNELINSYQARQTFIADAVVNFNKMRYATLARGYALETDNAVYMVSRILGDYKSSAESFKRSMTSFSETTQSDPELTESEKLQRMTIVNGINDLFAKYLEITAGIMTTAENRDRHEVIHTYEEAIPTGNDLGDKLQDLRDLVTFTTRIKTLETTDHINHIINMILVITAGFIIITVLALFFMVQTITKPISALEKAVIEIAKGNLAYSIQCERKDELGTLAHHISDMVKGISEHNKLMTIMDNLDSMICVSDLDYNFLYLNKRLADKFGLDREKCIGKKCYNATRGLSEPCAFCQLFKIIPDKDSFPSRDFEYVWDDVSNVWLGGTDSIIRWVDGSIVHFQAIRDVSQKKHQEELLEEALETAKTASIAKSSFLANMSHEIRTPMNAILGIAEIQLQDDKLPPKIREALDKIYNSGDLLLNIINDILDLSKIEAGKLELTPSKYEAASLINDTVTLNMMRIGSKPIEFQLSVDENTPSTLYGDELRIKQILNNLLSNAIKYTDEGVVKLLVSVEEDGIEDTPAGLNNDPAPGGQTDSVAVVFRISDTGQGMTKEQISKLFDEYSRFNMEANRTKEGAGLGMSITQNLIRLMNGKITVESEANRGTVFTVRIPQGRINHSVLGRALAESLEKFQASGTKQLKRAQIVFEPMPYGSVLVVDDVESNLYVAKGLMAPYGLSIDTVMSGFEAISKIKKGSVFDIVFMDHMMPKMDGIEATKHIRDLGYTQPIVALTANAVVGQSEVFLANGFDGFISKPIDVRQLDSTLKKFVRDKQPPEVLEAALQKKSGEQSAGGAAQPAVQSTVDPQLAEIFVRDARKVIATMEEMNKKSDPYGDEDIRLYTINVHAMKSALTNIGETALSAVAAKLEDAGREKNTAVMSGETPGFLDELRKIAEKLSSPENGDSGGEVMDENSEETQTYLREKMLVIKKACEAYDKKTAKNTIAELRQKTWTKATGDLLGTMAEHLLNGDFDEVLRTAEKITGDK